MKKGLLFARVTKVDEEKRLVYGVLAEEAVDKDNEIMDYETSKPYFEKWNGVFREKTEGESVGNLREMHGKSAAGRFVEMNYNDAGKKIEVCAKVVDDDAWKKVQEKVYTGFSIGARYVKQAKDKVTGAIRWTADPFEGSLVDNPCMYGADFTLVKADGVEVTDKFKAHSKQEAAKSMGMIGYFASAVDCLFYIASDAAWESEYEGDNSPLPEQIRSKAKELGDILVAYVREEVDEAGAQGDKSMKTVTASAEPGMRPKVAAKAADDAGASAAKPTEVPTKTMVIGEKLTKSQLTALLAATGITVTEDEKPVEEPVAAATDVTAKADGVNTVSKADFDALKTENATLRSDLVAINEKVDTILKSPMKSPVKVGTLTTEKTDDNKGADGAAKPEEPKDARSAIKSIHARGPQAVR